MPGPQRPPQQATQGPVHRVPCPWCSQPNDFRPLVGDEDGGAGWGSQGLERGAVIECDHCGRRAKVLAIDKITVIKLAKST